MGGQKANTRMPTDGLTNSISRFLLNSISYGLYNCGLNLVFFSWTPLLSFLRKTDHFSEDYKQVLLKRLIIIVIMVLRASFQNATQAVREREMSTNREISGIDNVSAYASRYVFTLGIRVVFCDVCKSKSLCDVYNQ